MSGITYIHMCIFPSPSLCVCFFNSKSTNLRTTVQSEGAIFFFSFPLRNLLQTITLKSCLEASDLCNIHYSGLCHYSIL